MAVWPAIPTTRQAAALKPPPAPWQRHTARWGVSPTLIEDGKWGAKSSAAIRQFQKAYRIANLALWPLRPRPTTCSAASDGGSHHWFKTLSAVQNFKKWTARPSSRQGAAQYHYIRIDTSGKPVQMDRLVFLRVCMLGGKRWKASCVFIVFFRAEA